MNKICIYFKEQMQVEFVGDKKQLLCGIATLVNIAKKEINIPIVEIVAAVEAGLDSAMDAAGQVVEKITEDTAISKEFADILRGMANE